MRNPHNFRLALLGSGKGSNAAAIADACAAGTIPAQVALVLSDVPEAGILDRARERGLEARYIPPGKFRAKLDETAEMAFVQALRQAEVDLVVLAGFMRILRESFSVSLLTKSLIFILRFCRLFPAWKPGNKPSSMA